MKEIEIRRPTLKDIDELNEFFRIVVTDTFFREGLGNWQEDINNEIKCKEKYLKSDLDSYGSDRYFLLALKGGKIVGTIEYGPVSDLIINSTEGALEGLVEIGTVFVLPDYQRQGIGNLLLSTMYHLLKVRRIDEFCLDSGYTNAQKIWKKKFGEPSYLLKDYWAEGFDHMIWRVEISQCLGN